MKFLFSFLSFATAFFLLQLPAAANEPKQSEILREANLALTNGQFVKATQLYYAAREKVFSKGGNELSDEEVYQLIQINRSIADAMAGGEFGDPCKPLGKANENMVALSIRAASERRHPFQRALSLASRQIQGAILEYDCTKRIVLKPDPEIAGVYYLRGVMETASGVKLDTDGRYEWFLSVGSLDLISKGLWHRQGDHVQLISDQPRKELKILSGLKEMQFEPREEVEDEFVKIPENANYAIIFESDESDNVPPRAFAIFGFADGREEMVGSVSYGRMDVTLAADDLPTSVQLLFVIGEEMIEVKADIMPKPGAMHQFTVRRPKMHELGITTLLFGVDGDTLKSPMVGQKGAYVKAKPKP